MPILSLSHGVCVCVRSSALFCFLILSLSRKNECDHLPTYTSSLKSIVFGFKYAVKNSTPFNFELEQLNDCLQLIGLSFGHTGLVAVRYVICCVCKR